MEVNYHISVRSSERSSSRSRRAESSCSRNICSNRFYCQRNQTFALLYTISVLILLLMPNEIVAETTTVSEKNQLTDLTTTEANIIFNEAVDSTQITNAASDEEKADKEIAVSADTNVVNKNDLDENETEISVAHNTTAESKAEVPSAREEKEDHDSENFNTIEQDQENKENLDESHNDDLVNAFDVNDNGEIVNLEQATDVATVDFEKAEAVDKLLAEESTKHDEQRSGRNFDLNSNEISNIKEITTEKLNVTDFEHNTPNPVLNEVTKETTTLPTKAETSLTVNNIPKSNKWVSSEESTESHTKETITEDTPLAEELLHETPEETADDESTDIASETIVTNELSTLVEHTPIESNDNINEHTQQQIPHNSAAGASSESVSISKEDDASEGANPEKTEAHADSNSNSVETASSEETKQGATIHDVNLEEQVQSNAVPMHIEIDEAAKQTDLKEAETTAKIIEETPTTTTTTTTTTLKPTTTTTPTYNNEDHENLSILLDENVEITEMPLMPSQENLQNILSVELPADTAEVEDQTIAPQETEHNIIKKPGVNLDVEELEALNKTEEIDEQEPEETATEHNKEDAEEAVEINPASHAEEVTVQSKTETEEVKNAETATAAVEVEQHTERVAPVTDKIAVKVEEEIETTTAEPVIAIAIANSPETTIPDFISSKGSRSVNPLDTAATLHESYQPRVAGQTFNDNLADERVADIGKALPTHGLQPSDGMSVTSILIAAGTCIALMFMLIVGVIFLISFRSQHGTLDIEMQEQRCGKDNLDEEDGQTFMKLLDVELPKTTIALIAEEEEECL